MAGLKEKLTKNDGHDHGDKCLGGAGGAKLVEKAMEAAGKLNIASR